HRGVRAVGWPQAHSHPEQGRRRGDHQRSGERRRPGGAGQRRKLGRCDQGGLLKVLAVMADERLPEYPDAPTLKELGYANGKGLWSALYAPSKTPPEVLETIHKATVAALNSAPVQEAFKKQMIKAVPDASI